MTVDLGPNNEICLLHDGEVVVYLTGYNARMYDVMDGEVVESKLPDLPKVIIGDEREIICDIYQFKAKRLNITDTDEIIGPGKLYVSDGPDGLGRAFFIDNLQPINQILACNCSSTKSNCQGQNGNGCWNYSSAGSCE